MKAPLIDSVRASPDGGRIGMVPCPGQRPGLQPTPLADALRHDLLGLRTWGAVGIVTLVEWSELATLGVQDLPRHARAIGLWWMHLPIRDMCAPDDEFERRWAIEGQRLAATLEAGADVVLHCWAGLGRTGTVAARLLIDAGIEARESVRLVRSARPGAIQTPQQELYLERCRPLVRRQRDLPPRG